VVRRERPEIVVTGNFRETWGGQSLNQADHIAVGRAVLDAVRDAGNRWIFPEQLIDGLEPWGGVREVWAFGSPGATHAVDTTDTFGLGVASLQAHTAYISGLGWENWDPREFLDGFSRPTGARSGHLRGAVQGVPAGMGFLTAPTVTGMERARRAVPGSGPTTSTVGGARSCSGGNSPQHRRLALPPA